MARYGKARDYLWIFPDRAPGFRQKVTHICVFTSRILELQSRLRVLVCIKVAAKFIKIQDKERISTQKELLDATIRFHL